MPGYRSQGAWPTAPLGPLRAGPTTAGSAAVAPEIGGEHESWLTSQRIQGHLHGKRSASQPPPQPKAKKADSPH